MTVDFVAPTNSARNLQIWNNENQLFAKVNSKFIKSFFDLNIGKFSSG
jgi:hypothetical protein